MRNFTNQKTRDVTIPYELARRRAEFQALPVEQQDIIRAQFEATRAATAALRARMPEVLAARDAWPGE